MGKLIGYLGRCSTPLCGLIHGYFCVKCRHFVSDCRCEAHTGGCTCKGEDFSKWWASTGERQALQQELAREEKEVG